MTEEARTGTKKAKKDKGSVEHIIPMHPDLWERFTEECKSIGISRRKKVQLILLERYKMEASKYLIDGKNDPLILAWRAEKNGKRRA